MKALWTVLTWLVYLVLGAASLALAGGLLSLAFSVGAVVLVIGVTVFIGAFIVFGFKEYFNPTAAPPPPDKQ